MTAKERADKKIMEFCDKCGISIEDEQSMLINKRIDTKRLRGDSDTAEDERERFGITMGLLLMFLAVLSLIVGIVIEIINH